MASPAELLLGAQLLARVLELDVDQGWRRDAACRERPNADWFPARGASVSEACAICRGCPVREPCLEYALEINTKFGMWGGRSERERRRVRRQRALERYGSAA